MHASEDFQSLRQRQAIALIEARILVRRAGEQLQLPAASLDTVAIRMDLEVASRHLRLAERLAEQLRV